MVQCGKVLATNPDDLSSNPSTHMVEETTDSHKLSSDQPPHAGHGAHSSPHLTPHTQMKEMKTEYLTGERKESWLPGAQAPWLTLGRGFLRSKI